MTVQKKFNPQQQAEYLFRKRHSRTKVWIALKNGQNKTFYANDCSATWLQLACGHVKEVEFSYLTGMEYMLAKEKFFKGKYNAIEVYRRGTTGTWPEEPVLKFTAGSIPIVNSDELPANIRCSVTRKPRENFVGFDIEMETIQTAPQRPAPVVETAATVKQPAFRSSPDATSAGAIARRAYGF